MSLWHVLPIVNVLAIFTVTGACYHAPKVGDVPDTEPDAEVVSEPLVLEVENHNWSDIVIYILADGRRWRFMDVTAAKDVSKVIPPSRQGTMGILQFIIHRIGTQSEYRTEKINSRLGHTIQLTIESNLERTSVGVF